MDEEPPPTPSSYPPKGVDRNRELSDPVSLLRNRTKSGVNPRGERVPAGGSPKARVRPAIAACSLLSGRDFPVYALTLVVDVGTAVSLGVKLLPDICCQSCCTAANACCAVVRLPDCKAWPSWSSPCDSFPVIGGTCEWALT